LFQAKKKQYSGKNYEIIIASKSEIHIGSYSARASLAGRSAAADPDHYLSVPRLFRQLEGKSEYLMNDASGRGRDAEGA
jgi:hypothetical protein